VAMRAIRAEAQGICSRSPFQLLRPVPIGKSNSLLRSESAVFYRSFLPERIFRFAARRTESGMSHGTTKSGVVISGDMILGLKLVWSQVAAGLRSPFRQKGPTSARTAIRHGVMRVLKTVVDGARLYRWADAAPLAGCLCVFIIRCPEIWSRDRAVRGR